MSERTTTEHRPPIPAEIRRRVFVEAGHRCAIHTCRHIEIDVHHIIPWSKCRDHNYENLIALCPNCHRRADRGDIDRKSLRIYKANLRFIHDKFSKLEIDVLFEAYNCEPKQPTLWPSFMRLLLGRVLDAGYIECHQPEQGKTFVSGLDLSPDHLFITQQGREFVDSIGTKKM